MIAYLRGVLIEKGPEAVIIDVGGVGYLVSITAATHRALSPVGAETRLHIYTHAVQDGPLQLFGFHDADERLLFETLLSVQGVGPRLAVAIVSGLPLTELVRAISTSDVARLTQIRGVGRKIAERMAVELREKIVGVLAATGGVTAGLPPGPSPTGMPRGRLGEVWAALAALGYKPAEIDGAINRLDATQPTPDLIKQALAALRRK